MAVQEPEKNDVLPTPLDKKLIELIHTRIEKLRPKLLDLTKRNPLISTKFSDRSNSIIRIIDEVPDFIFQTISSSRMRIKSLPALEEDPKDELSSQFQSSLAEARMNDKTYLDELDTINQENEEDADKLAIFERNLKDRIREKLGMSVRQTKNNLSWTQHAINNHIRPNYELLEMHEQHADGRHTDINIQTLLMPDALERKLNVLLTKDNTWKQEAGINVLHTAFGFLEWKIPGQKEPCYAPLLLLPIEIEKNRTTSGTEFWISANETNLESNSVLSEMLRTEHNIFLPVYDEELSPEAYFELISQLKVTAISLKVRRWVAIGIFPSTRLAMYHDLGTQAGWNFANHPVISTLFCGNESSFEVSPFGDEYNIDEPDIESKVPLIVTDADSSQYSTIVDVLDGKNLAVEGPPGTGKSQTIVNTIAAALATGKKVLFVAEKNAALEVVRSRLEAFGLGDFLLPLQATRSSKEQIISSIRQRLDIKNKQAPDELNQKILEFQKTRSELNRYTTILASNFKCSGLTVFQVLGQGILLNNIINKLSEKLKNPPIHSFDKISISEIDTAMTCCTNMEIAWNEAHQNTHWWRNIKNTNLAPFQVIEILNYAESAGQAYGHSFQLRSKLVTYNISSKIETLRLLTLNKIFSTS